MFETYPLIATIVFSVVSASFFGFLANRLHLPAILGYLVAGMMIGPHTPGFIADVSIAKQLAEIGVILLMFGVGLHFSMDDLISVNRIALPGALIQTSTSTLICLLVATMMGYGLMESLIFGISLSVASTVVLLRAFEQCRILKTEVAKIGVGWLIVEDIIMIIIVVLLPTLAVNLSKGESFSLLATFELVFLAFAKIIAFIMVMIVIGKKLLPPVLVAFARTKSRELMSLGILAIASGFALIAYTVFGASFALGAFMAGLILNESEIGKKSADKSLPLRDLFAVLFFISTGMLFDPTIILKEPILVILTLIMVVCLKGTVSYLIMRVFRRSSYESLILAASLAQIGEFSFIITALALKLDFISQTIYDMVIASALISITINPFLFKIAGKFKTS